MSASFEPGTMHVNHSSRDVHIAIARALLLSYINIHGDDGVFFVAARLDDLNYVRKYVATNLGYAQLTSDL